MKTKILMTTLLCCATIVAASQAEEIGSVDTEFKWLGPDHKIVVEAFDDPKIEGITCHLSRSRLAPHGTGRVFPCSRNSRAGPARSEERQRYRGSVRVGP